MIEDERVSGGDEGPSPVPSPEELAAAAGALNGAVVDTPLVELPELADQLGLKSLHLKLESMQRTGSFKFRGAYWRCLQLSDEERGRGVVAFSSGNFAQGLAAAAKALGTPATIVMPSDAPETKRLRTERFGATVVQTDHGARPREVVAGERAQAIAREDAKVLLHPFDDPHIVAGHASIAGEVATALAARGRALPEQIFCCVGGGGLLAGLAVGFAHHAPKTRVVPVEPDGYDSFGHSLRAGRAETLAVAGGTICDALQAPRPGDVPFACVSSVGAGTPIAVTDGDVRAAMSLAYDLRRIVLEPSGAVALAGLLQRAEQLAGCDIVVMATGANIEPAESARLLAS